MTHKIIIPVNQQSSEIEKILESLYPSLNIAESSHIIRRDDITYQKVRNTINHDNGCSIPISIEYGDSHIDGYETTEYLRVKMLTSNPLNPDIKYIPCTEISIDREQPEMIKLLKSYVQKVGGWFLAQDKIELFLNAESYCLSEDRLRYNIEAYRKKLGELTQSFWPSYRESGIERIIEEFYDNLKEEKDIIRKDI